MKSPKCCGKVMRCYQSKLLFRGNWTQNLVHYFQCMKCGELVEIDTREAEDE